MDLNNETWYIDFWYNDFFNSPDESYTGTVCNDLARFWGKKEKENLLELDCYLLLTFASILKINLYAILKDFVSFFVAHNVYQRKSMKTHLYHM